MKTNLLKDVSYPSIEDEEFQRKLYEKREFHIHRVPEPKDIKTYEEIKQYRDNACTGKLNLLSQQNLLSNFINPDTPFRGLLIFHNVGTGKTCSAIAICENFKEQVKKYNTKIYILVPGPLNKENWKDELIKCTRDTYKKEGDNNIIDKAERDKAMCKAKVAALQYYRIMSYRGFYKKVLGQKIIEKTTGETKKKSYRKTDEGDYERDLSIDRIDALNNTVIVVDEAHNITGNEYGLALQKIIENSHNLRVLLLSATPMKNLADDMIEMLNYLRPQDDPIIRDKIFTSDKNYNMNFKPGGLDYFRKMAQGYVSYYRGSNPLTFAKQVDMGEIPKGLLFIPVVRCPMESFQWDVYKQVKDESASNLEDALERRSAAVANFAFPSIDSNKNIIGVYGREGISNIRNQLNSNKQLLQTKIKEKFFPLDTNPNDVIFETKTKNIGGLIFKLPYLKHFSIKFNDCLTNLLQLVEGKKGSHTAFVYSNLVKSGIELFEQVLIQNGCLEWNENGNYQINDDTLDAITGLPYKDFIKTNIQRPFYPMTYLTVTGQSEESKDAIPEEKKRILDNVFSQLSNYDGRNIKFILGSKVMNEGITLRNVKEVHILDVYFNLGKVDQVIGRAIRHCVHYDIMNEENPYPEVNVFRYTVSVPGFGQLSTEEELYQKAEQKYILIKRIERTVKEVAIDCPLNYNGNISKIELDKYKDCVDPTSKESGIKCPATCDFVQCGFQCGDKTLNLKYYDRTTNLYKKITRDNLDYSTFTSKLARSEIDTAKEIIKELYHFQYVYTLDEIVNNIIKRYPEEKKDMFDVFFVYQALDELIPTTENDFNNFKDTVYDKYNVGGYLIFRNKYYIFQPFNENENTLMYYRSNYITELNHELTVQEYMNTDTKMKSLLEKNKDQLTKKESYKYTMEYYDERKDNFIVGILDSHHGEDVFKLRERSGTKRSVSSYARLERQRDGVTSIRGAICYTAKEKDELLEIVKKLNIQKQSNTRLGLCDLIKNRLLYLEKYETDDMVYMIVPINHSKYPFPLRLTDRIEYLNKKINRLLYTNVTFDKRKQDNGIFEDQRNINLPRYSIKFKHQPEFLKHQDELQQMGFQLKDDVWYSMIE